MVGRYPDPRVTSGGPQLRADRSLVDASVRGVHTSWNTSSRRIFWTQVCPLGPRADDDFGRVQGKVPPASSVLFRRGVAVQWCGHGLAVRRQVVDVSHLPRLADNLEPTATTSNPAAGGGAMADPHVLALGSGVPGRGPGCSTEGK